MDVAALQTELRVDSFFSFLKNPLTVKGIGFTLHNGLVMTSYYGTF